MAKKSCRLRKHVRAKAMTRHYTLGRGLYSHGSFRRAAPPSADRLNADLSVVLADIAGELCWPTRRLNRVL